MWFRRLLLAGVLCFVSTLVLAQDRLELSKTTLSQGDLFKVDLYTPTSLLQGTLFLGSHKFTIFRHPDSTPEMRHYHVIVGISRYLPPGKHKVVLSVKTKQGKRRRYVRHIRVEGGEFKKSRVVLKGKKKGLVKRRTQLSKESRLLSTHFKTITRFSRFSKPFVLPAEGKMTTQFGAVRSYNSNKPISKHSGLDIANVIGTPIYAPNDGKVIFASFLPIHGNTVMLDHGLGIVTVYNHLDSIVAKVGQFVSQGDLIAKMGTTGLSTGSHLHWGMSIQNVRVNPLLAMALLR